jgi:hypothetical protein
MRQMQDTMSTPHWVKGKPLKLLVRLELTILIMVQSTNFLAEKPSLEVMLNRQDNQIQQNVHRGIISRNLANLDVFVLNQDIMHLVKAE